MSEPVDSPEPVHTGLTLTPEELPRLCKQCEKREVRAPRGKVVALFCSSRCRAAWHNDRKRRIVAEVHALIGAAKSLLDEAMAVVSQLERKEERR